MRKRLLLVGAVVLLAVPLVYLLKDLARQVFLVQILRIAWVVRLLFESLPQTSVWAAFLVLASLIAVRSLTGRRRTGQQDSSGMVRKPGQVSAIARQIQHASRLVYPRRSLARSMRVLTLEVLAHQHRSTPGVMMQRLRNGGLELSPAVQAYLNLEQQPMPGRGAGLFSRLRHLLSPRTRTVLIDPDLEQTVRFIESQLEIGS
jgi:hypothetical protein